MDEGYDPIPPNIPPKRAPLGLFLVAMGAGIVLAAICFVPILMGECLPRDGGSYTAACDRARNISIYGYLASVAVIWIGAFFWRRRRPAWSVMLAFGAGPLMAVILGIIERWLVANWFGA